MTFFNILFYFITLLGICRMHEHEYEIHNKGSIKCQRWNEVFMRQMSYLLRQKWINDFLSPSLNENKKNIQWRKTNNNFV